MSSTLTVEANVYDHTEASERFRDLFDWDAGEAVGYFPRNLAGDGDYADEPAAAYIVVQAADGSVVVFQEIDGAVLAALHRPDN